MAAVAFDTLKAARRLIAAGMPVQQAEAQAEVMAEAFVFHVDKLVTQDYLDARFAEQDVKFDARFARIESRLDKIESRLAGFDSRFISIDTRFAKIDSRFAKIDSRFADIDSRLLEQDKKLTALSGRLDVLAEQMVGKFRLVYWMLAVVIASTTVPALQTAFAA